MLEDNPCRKTLFDVFGIDKSSTELKDIRRRIRDAREVWGHQKHCVKGPEGVTFVVDEARMNELEKRLLDPLKRLQEEQFVHQAHPFADDTELSEALALVKATGKQSVESVDMQTVVAGVLGALLPEVSAFKLPDDLPEPLQPEPFPIEQEPLEKAVQRDF
jgi:hypothetical protein